MQVNKIRLILAREYLTRIRKRSFIVMTLVGPVLMAALMIIPVWLSLRDVDIQNIQVIDETFAFRNELKNTATMRFEFSDEDILEAKRHFYERKFTSILYIPANAYHSTVGVRLYHKKQPGQRTLNSINNTLSDVIERDRMKLKYNISKDEITALKAKVDVLAISLEESGNEEKTHAKLSMLLGFGGAILIYFFIFLFGVQVMRGVIEEKSSRIVEVIISSVKPFQLMAGKIAGIALVGLTQFLLWVLLTMVIVFTAQQFIPESAKKIMSEQQRMEKFIPDAENDSNAESSTALLKEINYNLGLINFPLILFSFIYYFLGGYLLYGALFAAIGAAVDNEADSQQFVFPVTVPLILAFILAQPVIANPDGQLAFWLSVIPFTSPVIMMVRIPFGIGVYELMLSIAILAISFVLTTWLAGRIYRTGILLYGKKAGYRELWKWMRAGY